MKNSNIKRKFPLTMKNVIALVLLAFLSVSAVGQNQNLNPELSIENQSENLESQLNAKLSDYENLDESRSEWPPIWNLPTVTGINPHGIIVIHSAQPRINDSILKENDFIGGFFTDLNGELRCGGGGSWPGDMGTLFALTGDDPATTDVKEGFSYGEQIHFKLFSFNTMKDYDVDIIEFGDQYYGRDKWYPLTLSRIINMQALETFDFYISPTNNPLCIGEETTLSGEAFVAPGGSYNYLWSSSDPSLNFNYNIQIPPPVVPNATTTFYLTVDDGGSNSSQHALEIFVEEYPTVDAGQGGTICNNENFEVSGSATNYSTSLWTSSGDGEFADDDELATTYTPGTNDIALGQFTLTLTVNAKNPCEGSNSDNIQVSVLPAPSVVAGSNQVLCTNSPVIASAVANNYGTVAWTENGQGYFTNPNNLTTSYIPAGNDYSNTLTFIITVQAASPCVISASDQMTVNFVPGPTVNGPSNKTTCENIPVSLNGIGTNYSYIEWTTNGDGTFDNPNIFTAKYYVGPGDINTGSRTLTLTAYSVGDCASASKNVNLTIVSLPDISFDANSGNICVGDPFMQLNPDVQNSNNVIWTTFGDGTFSANNIVDPKYYPGTDDRLNGAFQLKILAYPLQNCFLNLEENLSVTFQNNPSSNAGTDAAICQGQNYTLAAANAQSYGSLQWSGGNGTFNNPQAIHPTYTPAISEYGTTVSLCLSASPISPCDLASNDCMQLTIQRSPTADAGANAVICEGSVLEIDDAQASDYTTLAWSGGSGIWQNQNTITPTYTPASTEYGTNVSLNLVAYPASPCLASVSDQKTLTIKKNPTGTAGVDASICQNQSYAFPQALAANYQSLLWSGGSGSFSNASILHPNYTPAASEYGTTVNLTLTVQPNNPCALVVSDVMQLSVQRNPASNAGNNATICQNQSYTLIQASATNYQTLLWSGGSGSFSNAQSLNPTYTPASGDYGNTITLTLTAQAISPCSVVASDVMQLSVQRNPASYAGPNDAICQGQSYILIQATATNYQTLLWSGGSGSFNNNQILKPTYTPAASEYGNTVTLTITAQAISPCSVAASDVMELFVQQNPESNAGNNATICQNQSYTLTQATASNYQSLLWSGGSGSFSNAQSLNPTYTPASGDYGNTITLTLTAQAISPCFVAASDAMQINITKLPTVDAGEDLISCEGSVQLNASAADYNSVQWQSSGDGTFSNANLLNAVYTPGSGDLANQQVVLTLSVFAESPCLGSISDALEISIDYAEIIEDNVDDKELNAGMLLTLQFNVSSLSNGTYQWYFNDELINGQVNPIFTKFGVSHEDAGYYYATFTNNCGVVSSNTALVQVLETYNQTLSLPAGWSGISSYVLPSNPGMEQVFASIEDQMLLVNNYNGMYWPAQNINTLGDFSNLEGYAIQMEENAQLTITGKTRFPLSPVTILPGWTYLPVNTSCPVDVQSQFAAFEDIVMIKDIAGNSLYWPEFGINTLEMLEPGKAYYALNEGTNAVSTRYNWCEMKYSGDSKSIKMNFDSPWNELHKSPQSHVFGFTGESLTDFENGDIIGAFNASGLCVGLMMIDGSSQANYLLAYGDDPSNPQIEGATDGEELCFRIFDTSQNKNIDLEIEYSDNSTQQGQFVSHGISTIKEAQVKSATALPDLTDESIEVNIYPNPTTGLLNIVMKNKASQNGEITLSNLSGQLVLQDRFDNFNAIQINISDLPKGVYYLKLISGNFVKTEKIILR